MAPKAFGTNGSTGWEQMRMGEEIANSPVSVVPKGVPGLLSDVDADRVRTGDLASLTHFENVRRWKRFNPESRLNSREWDLEVDSPRTLYMVVQLSPKGEGFPNENFRTSFVGLVADRYLPFNLSELTVTQVEMGR